MGVYITAIANHLICVEDIPPDNRKLRYSSLDNFMYNLGSLLTLQFFSSDALDNTVYGPEAWLSALAMLGNNSALRSSSNNC